MVSCWKIESTDAHDGCMNRWTYCSKGEPAPQPIILNYRVRLQLFPCESIHQAFVKGCGFTSPPPQWWRTQEAWRRPMLDITNTLAICPFLDVLMLFVGWRDGNRAVARCIRVKNPYIKICILSSRPESSCTDIETSIISSDSCTMDQGFTAEWLEKGFCGNIMAHFGEQWGCYITQFVVSYGRETPLGANHSMIGWEGRAAVAFGRSVGQLPAISEAKIIFECTGETMVI